MKRHSVLIAAMLMVLALGFAGQRHIAFADSAFTVNTAKDAPDANIGDGLCKTAANKCSLRAAIQEANFDPDFTEIHLAAATYMLKVAGTLEDAAATGDLDISTAVLIEGVSQAKTVVNANKIDRAFDVQPGGNLILHNLTIKKGYVADGQGGAINAESATAFLTLDTVTISGSRSDGAGGAVAAVDGVYLTVTASTFTGNKAPQGGALYLYAPDASSAIIGSTIRDNESTYGGGLTMYNTSVFVYQSVFLNNRAKCPAGDVSCVASEARGGAVYLQDGQMLIALSRFEKNTSSGSGGAIATWDSTLTTGGLTITKNTASLSGGGLYLYGTGGQSDGDSITGNKATAIGAVGGGATLDYSSFGFQNTTISGNSAKANGGGVYLAETLVRDPAEPEFAYTTIAFNTAANGGGIYRNAGAVTLDAVIVSGNTASASAPDCGGSLTATHSLIQNTAGCTILDGTGNLTGVPAQLEPLSYGIHGETLAHIPAAGSPALGGVAACGIAADQHGDYRNTGFSCSIGAIEGWARNLLVNSSFESGAAGWKITSPDGKDKVGSKLPFSGKKAFLFTGKPGKTSRVQQVVKKKSVLLAIPDGDSLCASGMFYTANSAGQNLTIEVQVKYSDGDSDKESQPVFLIDEMYIPGCSGEIYINLMGGTRTLKQALIRITSKSAGGKTYLDGVSLTWYDNTPRRERATRDGGVLPLPVAPDGFRGGN